MRIKQILCYIIALFDYVKYGVFIPHTYQEIKSENQDIFVSDDGFRVVHGSYEHLPGECLVRGVTVNTSTCVCCGKTMQTWQYDDVDVITEEWWS